MFTDIKKFLNLVYHLIRTLKEISLFVVLIFECLFPQDQSAGSYFAKQGQIL